MRCQQRVARALLIHRQCMYVGSCMGSCWAAALQACARGAGDGWAEGVAAAHRSSLQKAADAPRAALTQRRAQSVRKIIMLRLQADAEHRAARPLVHVVLGPLHTQRWSTVMSRRAGEVVRVQRDGARVVCMWAEAKRLLEVMIT